MGLAKCVNRLASYGGGQERGGFVLCPDQILDLIVGREAAGLAAGVFERAIDGDVELAGSADAQLDVGGTQLLEAIPHTEGLRLITSGAAIFDQDLHASKMGW
jgi:hypothetical protein